MAESPPPFRGILETVLYCAPGEREEVDRFYSELLGLPAVSRWEDGTSFRVGPGVLLVFDRERLAEREGPIAEHGSPGPGHACLVAGDEAAYEGWKRRVEAAGVEVTHEHAWRQGMRSFYFHDPAGNLLEVASGDIWPAP